MIPSSAVEMNTIYTMMKYFQHMFHALGQNWTYITYDEAIYSKAQMIKWRNPDEFKDDELEMGGMHRAMNFMGDIGCILEESGFEDITVESGVYGPSVVNHIMKGKAYNRGMRLHKLMNEALTRLKWIALGNAITNNNRELNITEAEKIIITNHATKCLELFSNIEKAYGENSEDLQKQLKEFQESTEVLHDLMFDYSQYCRECSDTFLFWDNYVSDYSQLLLDYVAAKRDDNREIELETSSEMIPLDFMCNHVNYARWSLINIADARSLPERRPDVYESLSGHSSVHHTTNPFSGVWHDMAIEQTLNKECGKYKNLCTKEEALDKYYLTAHFKAGVTAMVKSMSGVLTEGGGMHKEATQSRIQKDEQAVQRIVDVITERMVNPFEIENGASADNRQPLVNIATSTVAPKDVTEGLCNVRDFGEKEMDIFIVERLQNNTTDIFAPIPKSKLKTFASLNKPVVSKEKQTTKAINIDREIFSKLAIVAKSRDVDIAQLLNYELAPVPLTLFNLDETMRKTTKSDTLSWMEKDHGIHELPAVNGSTMLVIDFMMLLKMVCTETSNCKTFGDLSDALLSIILGQNCKYTAVVGDSYTHEDSIKSGERARRGPVEMQEIRNPSRATPLPKQRRKMLSNPKTKANIADFLMRDWCEIGKEKLDEGQIMYLAGGFKDPTLAYSITYQLCEPVEELHSDHEEADSRKFLHISYALRTLDPSRVVLWSIDSDVAAMCPRFYHILDINELYFKTGVGRKNRYIPMHTVANNIGEDMSMVLPALHVLSGCDSTSSFSGKGKKSWMNTLSEHPELLAGLQNLGENPSTVSENTFECCVQLISYLYHGTWCDSLNRLRYLMFSKKNLASEKLPPTEDAITQHLLRVNYQAYIWHHAIEQNLKLPTPVGRGWKLDEHGHIIPQPMTLPPAPQAILEFTQCGCKTHCGTRRCKCRKEGMVCIDACGCDDEYCLNRTVVGLHSDDDSGSDSEED